MLYLNFEFKRNYKNALNEISYSNIPDGNRAYDGTRAADHTGQGLDGKLRLFLDLNNCKAYPNLTKFIKKLQKKEVYSKIGSLIEKDLNSRFIPFVDPERKLPRKKAMKKSKYH